MTLKADILTDISAVFLDTDDFADSAVWTNQATPPVVSDPIPGIFDAPAQQVNPASGMIETTAPQLQVASSAVSGIARGDTLVISEKTYYFLYQQPDGTGMTVLILSEDAP